MPEKYNLLSGHISSWMNILIQDGYNSGLAGYRNIMRMAFQHTGIGDAGEFGIMQLLILAAPHYPIPARKPPVS